MNKYLRKKYTISALSILVFALCFGSVCVSAQILKPGEIIYSRLPNDINFPPTGTNSPTIWAVGQDGANDRQIITGTSPRISDDGRFLLFKRFTRAGSFNPFGGYADIFVRELATGQETLVFSLNFDQGSIGYSFSPESNQGSNEIILDNDCFLYKSNRDGSGLFQFPWANGSYCFDDFPVVRRGGDQLIAFQNFSDALNGGLYTVGINGANRQKIANTACGDFNPAWSNDSQFVAYSSLFEACSQNFPQIAYPYFVSNIFKIKPDGTNKQQLTNLTNTNCRLTNSNCLTFGMIWTEDNLRIIAAGRLNNVKGLFAFNTNGSGTFTQIPLSAGNAPDFVGGIVQPRVERQVSSFGGGATSGGNYTLVDTAGQAFAGQTSIGGAFNLQSGFWTSEASARTPFDFDGDGKADVSVFRPGNGTWYLQQSTNGFTGAAFGQTGDRIVPADYDGDGKTDIAVYRGGTWYLQRSQLGFTGVAFGASTDIPQPADFDGDGKSELAVFRPSNGTWYVLNLTNNQFAAVQFGQAGDKPVAADYDGDGKSDVAVNRAGVWYIQRSTLGFTGVLFGDGADKPVPADYDGDGKADIAVFRPSTGTWYLLQSTAGFTGIAFGLGTDLPAPADYDGDGKADVAVFRSGTWYLQRSTAGFTGVAFGAATDTPVPNAFVP